MKYIQRLRRAKNLSEQGLAVKAGVSRLTLRQIESGNGNPTVDSLTKVAEALDRDLLILLPRAGFPPSSDSSTVAVSFRVKAEGFESWPLHFMELVDEFRKHWDIRLLLLPPISGLDKRLVALLASICVALCEEAQLEPPKWSCRSYFLERPWFVSETNALKAFAVVESPLAFRRNNIFVQGNFLARA